MQAATRALGLDAGEARLHPPPPGSGLRASVAIHLQSVVLIQAQLQEAGTSRWLGHRGEEMSGHKVKENSAVS